MHHSGSPAVGSSCTWCHTPCHTRSSLRGNQSIHVNWGPEWSSRSSATFWPVPAVHPWDCWTWWNHSDGRYRISPALTLQRSGLASRYWGYRCRSGFRGSSGIHGTCKGPLWSVVGAVLSLSLLLVNKMHLFHLNSLMKRHCKNTNKNNGFKHIKPMLLLMSLQKSNPINTISH